MNKSRDVGVATVLIFLVSVPVFGDLVTVDPNQFQAGQVITAPGATLSVETLTQTGTNSFGVPILSATNAGPVFSFDVGQNCTFGAAPCAVDGHHLFAPSVSPVQPTGFGPGSFWTAGADNAAFGCITTCALSDAFNATMLRIDFAQPTNFVNVLGFNQGGDGTLVAAFNAAGQEVGSAVVTAGGSGFGWGDATILDNTADISHIVVAGDDNTFRPINEIEYNKERSGSVPLPDETWLLLSSVLLVMLFQLRRRTLLDPGGQALRAMVLLGRKRRGRPTGFTE